MMGIFSFAFIDAAACLIEAVLDNACNRVITLLFIQVNCVMKHAGTKLGVTCLGSIELHWIVMLSNLADMEE